MHTISQKFGFGVAAALSVAIASLAPALASTPPDACAVVSKGDAAKALGTPIVGMKARMMGPSSTCTIHGVGLKSIVVTTYGWSTIPEAQSAFQGIVGQTAMYMHPSIVLHGLGDQAQEIASSIYVRKGTSGYVFNVIDGTVGAGRTAKAIALAKSSIAHMH